MYGYKNVHEKLIVLLSGNLNYKCCKYSNGGSGRKNLHKIPLLILISNEVKLIILQLFHHNLEHNLQ